MPRSGVILLAALLLGGCTAPGDSPERIVVAVLPDQDADALRAIHAPLLDHLAESTGLDFDLVVPDDYADMVERWVAGEFHMGWFGALTYLQARERAGATPLAMRDVDLRFRSVFLVAADSDAMRVEDLEGARLSFGSNSSTSGHLMPRHFLGLREITPEEFFGEVQFAGSHDAAAGRVQDGVADVAAVNGQIAARMFADGSLDSTRVRILWETPPYHDYLWAVRSDLPEDVAAAILDGLIRLDPGSAADRAIIEGYGAVGFVPAMDVDFQLLESVARSMGMLEVGAP